MSSVDLPYWFWRFSPLSMDALTGPDEQYRAGAHDMLATIRLVGLLDDNEEAA